MVLLPKNCLVFWKRQPWVSLADVTLLGVYKYRLLLQVIWLSDLENMGQCDTFPQDIWTMCIADMPFSISFNAILSLTLKKCHICLTLWYIRLVNNEKGWSIYQNPDGTGQNDHQDATKRQRNGKIFIIDWWLVTFSWTLIMERSTKFNCGRVKICLPVYHFKLKWYGQGHWFATSIWFIPRCINCAFM